MLTVDEALRAVLARAVPLAPKVVPLADALGTVLVHDAVADLDLPPFDKSLVDGYALRSADAQAGRIPLRLVEEVTAGRVPTRPVLPGECSLIMTGAPLPAGADTVVMHEKSRREGDLVWIDTKDVTPGRNRLLRGREMHKGDPAVEAGLPITPARIGVLASVGYATVRVVPRPKVAVLPTGDELVEPGQVPGPGQIRNSNASMLTALAETFGARAEALPIAPDEPGELGSQLLVGLTADVLLITGGVSAGNLDLVPDALAGLGVERVFHKIRLKPGKPLWFGVGKAVGDRPGPLVFGLPGNPVSGIVGFLLFVRPALERLAGRPVSEPSYEVILDRPFAHRGDRPTYHPARLLRGKSLRAVPLDWAGSADLRSVARADGFVAFPAGNRDHQAGEIVRFLPLG